MPKETFYNLPEWKQELVLQAVKKEFERHPVHEASVKDIVTELGIARGSFYTYFENLEESYFTVLERETVETHELFIRLFRESGRDLFRSLELFGDALSVELFREDRFALYRNRFLFWTEDLDIQWKRFRDRNGTSQRMNVESGLNPDGDRDVREMMHFIRAIIHDLIRRLFSENWNKDMFIDNYRCHAGFIENGLKLMTEKKGE